MYIFTYLYISNISNTKGKVNFHDKLNRRKIGI